MLWCLVLHGKAMGRQTFDDIQLHLYSLTNLVCNFHQLIGKQHPLYSFSYTGSQSQKYRWSALRHHHYDRQKGVFSIVLGVVGGCGCLEDYFIRGASWSCLVCNPVYIKSSWIRFAFESWRRFYLGLEISLANRGTLSTLKLSCHVVHLVICSLIVSH